MLKYINQIIQQYEYNCIYSQNPFILSIIQNNDILYQLDNESILFIIRFLIHNVDIRSKKIKKQLHRYALELEYQLRQAEWLIYPEILLSTIDLDTLCKLQQKNSWNCQPKKRTGLYDYDLRWIIENAIQTPIVLWGKLNKQPVVDNLLDIPLSAFPDDIVKIEKLISFKDIKGQNLYIPIIIQNKGEN